MILLTGATGFVGASLLRRLAADERAVRACARNAGARFPDRVETFALAGLDALTDWRGAFHGVDVVVHAAARVHVMNETAGDPLQEFCKVNVDGTLHLARQAVEAGVRRFVFVSSVKVNGEQTAPGRPFTADQAAAPADPYGVSKWRAEEGLRRLSEQTGLEVVIIRPPLVYGAGVRANFFNMMRWLYNGLPLPLGSIQNKRSLVALDNLVDLIALCIDHPAAANQTFLAGDGEDLSTTELLRRIGAALGKPARLLPVPEWALRAAFSMIGKAISPSVCAVRSKWILPRRGSCWVGFHR